MGQRRQPRVRPGSPTLMESRQNDQLYHFDVSNVVSITAQLQREASTTGAVLF